jgi:hypothetical protein
MSYMVHYQLPHVPAVSEPTKQGDTAHKQYQLVALYY